jgi:hypothetical protein
MGNLPSDHSAVEKEIVPPSLVFPTALTAPEVLTVSCVHPSPWGTAALPIEPVGMSMAALYLPAYWAAGLRRAFQVFRAALIAAVVASAPTVPSECWK